MGGGVELGGGGGGGGGEGEIRYSSILRFGTSYFIIGIIISLDSNNYL